MTGLWLFLVGLIGIAVVIVGARFKFDLGKAKDYFRNTEPGRQAWGGVIKFVGIAAVAGLLIFTAKKSFGDQLPGYWFKELEIYAGAELPGSRQSIFCEADGIDSKTTSNGGINLSIYQRDGFRLLSTYQHHSCAFNGDVESYDAFGLSVSYTLDLHSFF